MSPSPAPLRPEALLEELRRRIRGIEERARTSTAPLRAGPSSADGIRTGWQAVDEAVGTAGFPRGVLHEWIGVAEADLPNASPGPGRWTPPLLLLGHLAAKASAACASQAGSSTPSAVLWIGRHVRPYAPALAAQALDLAAGDLLAHTFFVDPPDDGSRLWAIDVALRCRALAAVVADASGLRMAQSRRLQLAAEAGSAFALLTRPPWEQSSPSVAGTRWRVARLVGPPTATAPPAWSLTLLRSKVGARAAGDDASGPWRLEWDHAHGVVESALAASAELVRRPCAPTPPAPSSLVG